MEGQETELAWIRDNRWSFGEDEYERAYLDMVTAKTGRYSFVTPVAIGCILARASAEVRAGLEAYGHALGIAFQIFDDVLNLVADEDLYGKEQDGDLWEGKRTLILLHALALEGDTPDRARAIEILEKPRPTTETERLEELRSLVDDLDVDGHIDEVARNRLSAALAGVEEVRTAEDVSFLRELIERHGSIEAAREVALAHCRTAQRALDCVDHALCRSKESTPARAFLHGLIPFVVERLR